MNSPLIIQVVGYSKSGKTTLISKLVEILSEKSIRIFAIKSARTHDYKFTTKDSDKFLYSGASSSAVVFKNHTQISINGGAEISSLVQALSKLNQFDIVILEGFKELHYPKIFLDADEVPNSEEVDYSTIRYLYSAEEQKTIKHKSLDELLKANKITLTTSVKELASRIILDLENG